jgi:lactate dehydrogenase-like 2-hydroxyacid dehydrogenase
MSAKPKLWITRKLSNNILERAKKDYDVLLNPEDADVSTAELIETSHKVDAIMPCHSEHFDQDVVSQLGQQTKIIANYSVGTDHCDLAALAAKGIVVTNTPDVLSDATAEIVMLLLLGASRRASEGDRLVRSGQWTSWSPSFMVGHQPTGKRLGIIGMGKVGQVVARRARGFDMEVHYHNRGRLSQELESGAIFHESLDSLLNVSEFLSLNCPATPESRGILNKESISKLPDGAIVVNAARGALIVENDLLAALSNGKLAAAGLDCFNNEPGGNPEFSQYDNVFMLPHIGSATFETRDAMGFRALDNLDAFFRGDAPLDRVA